MCKQDSELHVRPPCAFKTTVPVLCYVLCLCGYLRHGTARVHADSESEVVDTVDAGSTLPTQQATQNYVVVG